MDTLAQSGRSTTPVTTVKSRPDAVGLKVRSGAGVTVRLGAYLTITPSALTEVAFIENDGTGALASLTDCTGMPWLERCSESLIRLGENHTQGEIQEHWTLELQKPH